MTSVRRFYTITNADTGVIRAWRGHRIEQRWLHVTQGIFEVILIKIDDWMKPAKDLKKEYYLLKASNNEVLHIPQGYASSLQAKEDHSKMIVFADFGMEHAKNDDYLFPADYFTTQKG